MDISFESSTFTITEPFETAITIVEFPVFSEESTVFSTLTLGSFSPKPNQSVIVYTGTTTYTTSFDKSITSVTKPVESSSTIFLSSSTEANFSENQFVPSITATSEICTSCKTSSIIESGVSVYTIESEGSVIVTSQSFTFTYFVVESTGASSVETMAILGSEKKPQF